MTEAIIILTTIACIAGISVAVWSTIDTRKKYGNRKRSASD